MPSPTKTSRRTALLAALLVLSHPILHGEETAPPMLVTASSSAAQATPSAFLTSYISTAGRRNGSKLISCLTTAIKLRPDLAGKIVVATLNICRLNTSPLTGRLPLATINQIVTAAVAAAPESVTNIVKAAIQSEPYARSSIVAAATAAAPQQASNVQAVAVSISSASSMSILSSVASFNPAEDATLPVNSPEQPPSGP